jgi:hypothetical protein
MDLRRIAPAVAIALFQAVPALAGPQDDALTAVAKCASIADDHARLACYDAAAPQVKAATEAIPAQVATVPPQQTQNGDSWFGLPDIFGGRSAQTTPKEFGNDDLPAPPPPPPAAGQPASPPVIDSITAGVSDYAFNPFGHFTVFLDNGQIWQQLEGDVDVAHFSRSHPNKVTISRGALGSYELSINDQDSVFKVKRLK